MHPNPAFRQEETSRNIAFAREQGFGVLSMNGDTAPLISHIPFILDENGTTAEFHLVRSNPVVRQLKDGPRPARLAVQGPHGYISPDWYGLEDQVPTWNYVAVHLLGEVELRPQDTLYDLLDRQSAVYETRLLPKPAWTMGKMTEAALERMMRQIVPCRMRVDSTDGTWKLAQNKPDAARKGAADGLAAARLGNEAPQVAALMHAVPDTDGETA